MCARVSDAMTEDVVTCENDTSLEVAARRMLRKDVGSVIVTNDGEPYGIVTESDVVAAAYHTGRPLAKIPTKKVASHPLETVEPNQSLRLAVKRMREERIKKLVAVDGLEIEGIVTTQDLVDHFGGLTGDVKTIRRNRERRTGLSEI